VKYPLLLSDFNETSIFLADLLKKKSSNKNFMKIHQMGTELFRADGQMDGHTDRHDEANNHFC